MPVGCASVDRIGWRRRDKVIEGKRVIVVHLDVILPRNIGIYVEAHFQRPILPIAIGVCDTFQASVKEAWVEGCRSVVNGNRP